MKPKAGVSPYKAAQGTGKPATSPFAKKLGVLLIAGTVAPFRGGSKSFPTVIVRTVSFGQGDFSWQSRISRWCCQSPKSDSHAAAPAADSLGPHGNLIRAAEVRSTRRARGDSTIL
jgi:hypothetical protein